MHQAEGWISLPTKVSSSKTLLVSFPVFLLKKRLFFLSQKILKDSSSKDRSWLKKIPQEVIVPKVLSHQAWSLRNFQLLSLHGTAYTVHEKGNPQCTAAPGQIQKGPPSQQRR